MPTDILYRLKKAEFWQAMSTDTPKGRFRYVTYTDASPGIIEDAANEIERLRAALWLIKSVEYYGPEGYELEVNEMRDLAIAALAGEKK